eukprot:426530-Pelagomonas_calceolata.AAC.3
MLLKASQKLMVPRGQGESHSAVQASPCGVEGTLALAKRAGKMVLLCVSGQYYEVLAHKVSARRLVRVRAAACLCANRSARVRASRPQQRAWPPARVQTVRVRVSVRAAWPPVRVRAAWLRVHVRARPQVHAWASVRA